MQTRRIPLTIRLAGLWILWAAWCQCCGWGLSAIHQLSGWGYLAAAPILFGAGWWWFKITAAAETKPVFSPAQKMGRRFRRPLPMIYLGIAALSLVAALLYTPWSFDATSYRLPRILYWWAEHHWYWIGTLDHRLDFSSCGFEWQMLPVIIFTRTDRLIFLLSWIPFLLTPGLVFFAFRALGVNGRSARRWMWLLPSGFCFALQCSGLQNDGYALDYSLVVIVFAVLAFRWRQMKFFAVALLAVALLTGAKLSNLPLLLPFGLLLLPALFRVPWLNVKFILVLLLTAACSFAPLAWFGWKNTGDWTGDPTDQWSIHPRNAVGALAANSVAMASELVQPPVFPIAKKINATLQPLNHTKFMQWLQWAQPNSNGIHFGDMAYEGGCGLGCGIGIYLILLIFGCWFVKPAKRSVNPVDFPWEWRWAPWAAWLSLAVLMSKLASTHTTRYASSYYPLLLISILLLPRIAAVERKKLAGLIAIFSMFAVVPVILLTPVRPVIPVEKILACLPRKPALETFLTKYRMWAGLRDDLAPMRNALPPDTAKLGYAGAFRDTSYGLWKPFGSRTVVELGLPLGGKSPPPADLKYAVVTGSGLRQRYDMDLKAWCEFAKAKVIFEMQRNISLEGAVANYDSWYLVQFQNK